MTMAVILALSGLASSLRACATITRAMYFGAVNHRQYFGSRDGSLCAPLSEDFLKVLRLCVAEVLTPRCRNENVPDITLKQAVRSRCRD